MFPGIAEHARLRLVKKACTRCGVCVKACPTGAMKTDADGHPCIHEASCIACYCCHELCPERAWKMKGLMGILQRRRPS
jgi:ferredoxin